MGVPKFFRWLSERYPLINQKVGEETETLPEFHNLYLDVNGIIHGATHKNDEVYSKSKPIKDMVLDMCACIDDIVHVVKPKRALVVCVDGCAPRAKMNQQRARRFGSAKDRRERLAKAVDDGLLTAADAENEFDSNCITPGTEFMAIMDGHLRYFIQYKIQTDILWRNLEVVYSGHNVPGEGEHKIMDYIRHMRAQPGYDPNTRHCICGLDADLIMLALASHEPHFSLLREEVDFSGGRSNFVRASSAKESRKAAGRAKWELLHLSAVRQYLQLELCINEKVANLSFGFDLENCVDDWILLVMLCGNDFLPHLASISIAEGGLNMIMELYRELLPSLGGYLTSCKGINFDRLEIIFRELANREEEIFEARSVAQKGTKKGKRKNGKDKKKTVSVSQSPVEDSGSKSESEFDASNYSLSNLSADRNETQKNGSFRQTYYREKFGVDPESDQVENIIQSYIEGLQWCFLYYFHGVPSWTWYFPYHYSPLATDMIFLAKREIKIDKGEPFLPFAQLMACLPLDSYKLLPRSYQELMCSPTSPLREFYPEKCEVDMNGKRNSWEGITLLPFIDESLLQSALVSHKVNERLTSQEKLRNEFGEELLFAFDVNFSSKLNSLLPLSSFPNLSHCQVKVRTFDLPPVKSYVHGLLPGTIANGKFPGDARIIDALTLDSKTPCSLEIVPVNIFNRPSVRESVVLNVRNPGTHAFGEDITTGMSLKKSPRAKSKKPAEIAWADSSVAPVVDVLQELQERVSKNHRLTVWINFPYLREAQVMAAADSSFLSNLIEEKHRKFRFCSSPQKEYEAEDFLHRAKSVRSACIQGSFRVGTGGVKIEQVFVMLKVRPLERLEVDIATGALSQIFSTEEVWVPYQCVCYRNCAPDTRFLPRKGALHDQRFPVGMSVISLEQSRYGEVGKVVNHADLGAVVEFDASKNLRLPNLGHVIVSSVSDKYFPLSVVARKCGLDYFLLRRIIGCVYLDKGKYDIGLNFSVGRDWVVPGYARLCPTDTQKTPWAPGHSVAVINNSDPINVLPNDSIHEKKKTNLELSSVALKLVAEYRKMFPTVVSALQKHTRNYDLTQEDIFGTGRPAQMALQRVTGWLESIESTKLPLFHTSSQVVAPKAIVAIQSAADEVRRKLFERQDPILQIVTLPYSSLFRKSADLETAWAKSPTAHVPPILGDRVLNMASSIVPFGLGGIVVAIHPRNGCVEVVFDEDFVGGTDLQGKCSKRRGLLLLWNNLLNLSKPIYSQPVLLKHVKGVQPIRSGLHANQVGSPVAKAKVKTKKSPEIPAKDLFKSKSTSSPAVPILQSETASSAPNEGYKNTGAFNKLSEHTPIPAQNHHIEGPRNTVTNTEKGTKKGRPANVKLEYIPKHGAATRYRVGDIVRGKGSSPPSDLKNVVDQSGSHSITHINGIQATAPREVPIKPLANSESNSNSESDSDFSYSHYWRTLES